VVAALDVATRLADTRFLPAALSLSQDEDPVVRARAVRLIGAIGGTEGVAALQAGLGDADAGVRAGAAHALGRLAHWPAAALVAPLLRDQHWGVRREAALALRDMGAPGKLFLRRALSDPDRFAADMARQILDLPALPAVPVS
jgi:HEAT repeat protein